MSFNSPKILWQILRQELIGLADLCFPPICPLCRQALQASALFCSSCLETITPVVSPRCSRCDLPFAAEDGSDHLCQACLQDPPPFLWAKSVGLYDETLRRAVQKFKYEGDFNLDRPLAALMKEALQGPIDDFSPDLLLPVPLYVTRLRQRSYNQALLLAKSLGRSRQVPVAAQLLLRIRPTPPQIGLKAVQRRRNLRGAFALSRPLQGERVLLVDDVMTTGATARECSRTLLDGGAGEVAVAVLARARLHG
ncbi:MAG: ComF family protein [Desulfuromonadaceae bacterium]|nr:ComF family protein [Desulfuromonadaceae bacterium]